jgi:hypothetical protein
MIIHWCLGLLAGVLACGDASSQDNGERPKPPSGSLTAIADLSVARAAHTATKLLDGRVLIVGGLSGAGVSASAELFDPLTRRFATTGALSVPRVGHTATLLGDGRVLIAGGSNGAWLGSTEVYDPRSGSFSPGPDLTEPRSDHAAIELADGRGLLVGGTSTGYSFLSSAELFDPGRFAFERTGSMSVARESHVGVRLPNGLVLVAGGHVGRRSAIRLYETAELYDPAAGTFRATGSMTRRRHKHAGALMADGRVLITGGADERDNRGQYRDAEVYEPETERFVPIGDMHRTRYKHQGTMTLLADGRILIAGGAGDPELFDPATRSFQLAGSSNALAPNFATATRLASGDVLITGGYGEGVSARPTAWLFVP